MKNTLWKRNRKATTGAVALTLVFLLAFSSLYVPVYAASPDSAETADVMTDGNGDGDPSLSPSPSASPVSSPAATSAPTASATPTAAVSPTPSVNPSPSATPSVTPSATARNDRNGSTVSGNSLTSATPTLTPSPSPSPSASPDKLGGKTGKGINDQELTDAEKEAKAEQEALEKAEREKAEKERAEKEKAERERTEREREEREREREDRRPKPALNQTRTVNDVTVNVDADEGLFPEGATLSVRRGSASERGMAEDAVEEVRGDDSDVAVAYTFDIKIVDTDGSEIEPDTSRGDVRVSFRLAEAADESLNAEIYHITEGSGDSLSAERLDASISGDEISAYTDGFSLYTVVFTYQETAQSSPKTYTLPVGSKIPLAEILTAAELTGTVTNAISDDPSCVEVTLESGTYYVKAKTRFDGSKHLTVEIGGGSKTITLTSAAATPSTITDLSATTDQTWYRYTGSAIAPTVTVRAKVGSLYKTLTAGTDYTITGDTSKSATCTAGSMYSITVSAAGDYEGLFTDQTIRWGITDRQMTVNTTPSSYTYDTNAHGLGSGAVSVVTPGSGTTIAYGTSAGNYTLSVSPTFTSAGTHTVYFRVRADEYQDYFGQVNVVINPAVITVTPSSGQTKVYGTSDPVLAYTPSPALPDGVTLTGALGRASGENVGSYRINQGTLACSSSNYTLTVPDSVDFTITAAASHGNVTLPEVEVSAAGVSGGRISLSSAIDNGTTLVGDAVLSGDLAGKLSAISINGTNMIYTLSSCDAGKTGTIKLTVSNPNYTANYEVTVPIKSKAEVKAETDFSKDSGAPSVNSVNSTNLGDYARSLSGTSVEVHMDVRGKSEDNVDSNVVSRVKSVLSGLFSSYQEGQISREYLNITIRRKINGSEDTVADVGRVLEIVVDMNLSGKYNLAVLRDHNGSVTSLNKLSSKPSDNYSDDSCYIDTSNNKIYIYSRYFSVYTIAYTTAQMYKVTFNYGTGQTTQMNVAAGSKVIRPSDPVRPGYTFTGWFLGGAPYNFDAPVNSDLTLVAGWLQGGSGDSSRTNAGGTGDGSTPSYLPRTGDDLPVLWFWIIVMAAGLGLMGYAIFGAVSERRRG